MALWHTNNNNKSCKHVVNIQSFLSVCLICFLGQFNFCLYPQSRRCTIGAVLKAIFLYVDQLLKPTPVHARGSLMQLVCQDTHGHDTQKVQVQFIFLKCTCESSYDVWCDKDRVLCAMLCMKCVIVSSHEPTLNSKFF